MTGVGNSLVLAVLSTELSLSLSLDLCPPSSVPVRDTPRTQESLLIVCPCVCHKTSAGVREQWVSPSNMWASGIELELPSNPACLGIALDSYFLFLALW